MPVAAPQKRFVRRGVAKFFYLKTIADDDALIPTRAEITAGMDITSWVRAVRGFQTTSSTIPTPDMGSRFAGSIPGETSVSDSGFDLYDDLDAEEVEETFPIEDDGYIVIMRKGDKPATPTMDVYQTRVSSRAANYTTDLEPAYSAVAFSIDREPALDLPVPTA